MFLAIRKRLDQREEGFTLIELLVVVIIIGILAAIAIPTFLRQRERAWEAAAQSALRNAAVAQQSYFTENNTYTTTRADLTGEGWVDEAGVTDTFQTGNATTYVMCAMHATGGDKFRLSSATGQIARLATRATAC